jgi:hypothetical protein
MGTVKAHLPVKYFVAFAFTPEIAVKRAIAEVENIFSSIDFVSETYDYTQFTKYYTREMGAHITKQYLVFERLMPPEQLPAIKLATNQLEHRYKHKDRRRINMDPGYMSEAKIVLATTKNYAHRIYLNSGIFADLHLQYVHKQFQAMPWTYPDYQTPEILRFFEQVRERYLQQLKDAEKGIEKSP